MQIIRKLNLTVTKFEIIFFLIMYFDECFIIYGEWLCFFPNIKFCPHCLCFKTIYIPWPFPPV